MAQLSGNGGLAALGDPVRPLRRPLRWLSLYGGMIREIAVTDFKLKYQGSVLGYLWSVAKPLMLFAILYFVFTKVFRLGGSVPHYGHYLLLGIVLWSYFVDATVVAMVSVVDRGELIRKVYFPRIIIPIAASISALITLVLNLLVLLVFIALGHVGFHLSAPLLIPLLLELYLLALGCSLLLAALYVRFRDFRHIWEVFLQMFFYASPIIYPLAIAGHYANVMVLSPIAQVIEDARKVMITPETKSAADLLPWPLFLIPYLIPVVIVAIGYWYFEATAAKFAEEL
jgi:ABC-2 type transport system permease protein